VKVLIACEYSGRTRDAFRAKGHDAISCDFHPTEVPGPHYQGDVRDILYQDWDLIIAHPDCTYLTNAGVRWLFEDCKATTKERRWELMQDACDFFNLFLDHPCKRVCIENPIPHKYAVERLRRNWDQSVQPWQFGDMTTKRTCYWLTPALPKLVETNNVYEEMMMLPYAERAKVHYASPGLDRWKFRSRTPQGFSEAMAEQWG
jgi:hypothetical protein